MAAKIGFNAILLQCILLPVVEFEYQLINFTKNICIMSPQKKRSRKAAINKNNNLLIFFAIILVIAIISVVAAYYLSGEENSTNSMKVNETEKTVEQITPLEGTWVSNYDGTMLTVEGQSVTFESPSVDESNKVSGEITIEENIVTFSDEEGACKNIEGHYLYSIDEKDELFFKLIKDSCPKRLEIMTASWFKL